jgi:hypothetical protein
MMLYSDDDAPLKFKERVRDKRTPITKQLSRLSGWQSCFLFADSWVKISVLTATNLTDVFCNFSVPPDKYPEGTAN